MKLSHVRILNYNPYHEVEFDKNHLRNLVGSNNAEKSTLLRTLEFLFYSNSTTLNEESFWNKDTSLEIKVEAVFSELTEKEIETLKPYLTENGELIMVRSAKMESNNGINEEGAEMDKRRTKLVSAIKNMFATRIAQGN
jgi:putative ATP-dependent endonuclease of OLD family